MNFESCERLTITGIPSAATIQKGCTQKDDVKMVVSCEDLQGRSDPVSADIGDFVAVSVAVEGKQTRKKLFVAKVILIILYLNII